MTFPNDFWMHYKVAPLSDAAFRAFVEMNGYSRMNDLDGVIPAGFAEYRWGTEVLRELIASHDDRPLLIHRDGTYVIREYAEHQQTTAAREKVREAKAKAGANGAAKRWGNRPVAGAIAKDSQSTEFTDSSSNEEESTRKRAHSIPSGFSITEGMRAWATIHTPSVDIDRKLGEFIDYWTGVGKPMKDWEAVWRNGMRKQQEFAERDGAPRATRDDENLAVVARLAAAEQKGIEA